MNPREQIREAVRCYHAGAYRASIVMAVSAGMHDLRRRVDELVLTGSGNLSKLKSDVENSAKARDAWERLLLDGCLRDDILSAAEHQKLGLLLEQRHLCAHPTGHHASPEAARSVIADLIDIVLSRPLQVGGREVPELIKKFEGAHFMGSTPAANEAQFTYRKPS